MGHHCPKCALRCHCGGDIDDLIFDDNTYANQCEHCPEVDDDIDCFEDDFYDPEKDLERDVMKLSKPVPARTKTLTALWCHKDFIAMSPNYRAILAKMRDRMDQCYWCGHVFVDGEMMALACFEGIGNKTLCHGCADQLLASDNAGTTT